jgi:hypothetical protein
LAFLKIEFEPLIILGLLSCFFLFLTFRDVFHADTF